jgi:uncharacterized radical SAM superfamily Fe-S cluster-containing enzyme
MKKLFIIGIFSLITLSGSAQVKNLKDLILLSELSVYELVENLQYSWNLSQPYQEFSDDKTEVTERHTYTFKTDVGTQVLQHVITQNLNTSEINETTSFVYNDLNLLKLIKTQLTSLGFVKQKDSTYSDGRTTITLYEEATDDIMLAKGYFMLLIE